MQFEKEKYLQKYKDATEQFYTLIDQDDKMELLGWNSRASQYLRFEVLLDLAFKTLDLKVGESILDAGCGYAALLHFIESKKLHFSYTGIDSNESYIQLAKKRFPQSLFFVKDLLSEALVKIGDYDVVFLSGVLNLDIALYYKNQEEKRRANYAVIEHVLYALCNSARKGLVCNFLHYRSSNRYHIFNYHNPKVLIDHLQSRGFEILEFREGYLDNDFTLALRLKKGAKKDE